MSESTKQVLERVMTRVEKSMSKYNAAYNLRDSIKQIVLSEIRKIDTEEKEE